MKNAMLQLVLVLIGITGVHAVKLLQTSSNHAHIHPAAAAEKAPAIHKTDSLKNTDKASTTRR
ncbi:MAG TPA: hypothetical protein VGM31_02040 [Puia sp.]